MIDWLNAPGSIGSAANRSVLLRPGADDRLTSVITVVMGAVDRDRRVNPPGSVFVIELMAA